ncbi:protein kinase domain-containing protein [Candidatus Uabimicrobium amorphum]|uniref:Serine/threonine protein kinase n=1 Tax=Uabimicrobium amorphum TaxID=2596890 RepID=A0A5S9IHH2_UABAM|nr:protein kinase [Candidatus Uabimicrobium amorphum]BBM81888.1 serine/threonine protein kinase [Candidatus Uabimicrobium amorphum]
MENLQNIHLTTENLQQDFDQTMSKVASVKEAMSIDRRVVSLPAEYQDTFIYGLFSIFKRECWLLKTDENEGRIIVEIDLKQAAVQFYYNKFEGIVQNHISSFSNHQRTNVAEEAPIKEDQDFDFTMCLGGDEEKPKPMDDAVDVPVYTQAPEQMIAWDRFASDYKLQNGQHYTVRQENAFKIFTVRVLKIPQAEVVEDSISRIKKFFEGDYNIVELDKGGMGAILKLTTKHDPTILPLRPENVWARQKFADYLQVRKDAQNRESIYAEIPKGMDFVAKVAFEGHEEALIQEAALMTRVAEDPEICETIIGAIQHGRVFAVDGNDKECLGYYLLMEFAPEGNTEQLYKKFPNGRLTPTVAFAMMYGMVRTLQKLKRKGIIHRDIKPLNVLLGDNGMPKLSDFGLSLTTKKDSSLSDERRRLLRIVDENFLKVSRDREQTEAQLRRLLQEVQQTKDERTMQQIKKLQFRIPTMIAREEACAEELRDKYRPITAEENAQRNKFEGSIYYAAPEQFEPTNILNHKCDVYQLGTVMFTMLTGLRPISGNNLDELVDAAMNPNKPRVNDFIKGQPLIDEMSDLIHEMITFEYENRIEIDEVRERMDQILFSHALELRKQPNYVMPPEFTHPEDIAWWEDSVKFAKKIHSTCMETIFNSFLHG